jgi:hypothetical protein
MWWTRAQLAVLGIGVMLGALAGREAFWVGLVIALLGVLLVLAGGLRRDTAIIPDNTVGKRPNVRSLGTRVEQILREAEQQAETHMANARREADEIVVTAREEAARIRNQGDLG